MESKIVHAVNDGTRNGLLRFEYLSLTFSPSPSVIRHSSFLYLARSLLRMKVTLCRVMTLVLSLTACVRKIE